MSILDRVRDACSKVAARARHVSIDRGRLTAYARALPRGEIRHPPPPRLPRNASQPSERAAFVLCMDAINFGSGWFPLLRKLPGHSGYRTLEAQLCRWFEQCGPPTPDSIRTLEAKDCGQILGQPDAETELAEVLSLYSQALRDLGHFVGDDWLSPIERAEGSAEHLVEDLCRMPSTETSRTTRSSRFRSSSAPRSPPTISPLRESPRFATSTA